MNTAIFGIVSLKLGIHMKRVVLILVSIFSLVFAQEYDFRSSSWGMTKQEVISHEKLKLIYNKSNHLGYMSKISGLKTSVLYTFSKNHLSSAGYMFREKHSNKNDYINDYEYIKKVLIDKYGQPIVDEKVWRNDLYKNDYQNYGLAVSIGHLRYDTQWETDKTKISLDLLGDNYKISMIVKYKAKALINSVKKERLKDEGKNF